MSLRNVGICLQVYTVSQSTESSASSPPRELLVSEKKMPRLIKYRRAKLKVVFNL
jgi:hypothetical protein